MGKKKANPSRMPANWSEGDAVMRQSLMYTNLKQNAGEHRKEADDGA